MEDEAEGEMEGEAEELLVGADLVEVHREVEVVLVIEAEAEVLVDHSPVEGEDQGEALAREVVASEEEGKC